MKPIPHGRQIALEDYRRYPGCKVMFACQTCGYFKAYEVLRVIHRLRSLRAGNSGTPVVYLAKHMKRACPRCCETRWETRLAYPGDLDEREWKRMVGRLRS